MRGRLLAASVLCILGIILYWTPLRVKFGDVNVVLGGYPSLAAERGFDPTPWFTLGYILTAVFALLSALSMYLAIKLPASYYGSEEVRPYVEEEETVTYEEEFEF